MAIIWAKLIPRWGGLTIEPPEGKKDAGYIAGDKPPAKWENWLRKGTYEALDETRDVIENIDSQLAQDALNLSNHIDAQGINAHGLSGKIIHSAGSNANGKWIRFEDGTQICTRQMSLEPFTANTLKSYNVDYPASFLGYLSSITLNVRTVDSTNDFGINMLRANDFSGSTFTLHGKFTVTQLYGFAYIAIGRWK